MGSNGYNPQAIFEQRFGKGSYNQGLQQAYNSGRSQWLAQQQAIQQQMFMDQQKQAAAQQKAQEAQQQAQDKAYKSDPAYQIGAARSYLSDPSINQDLRTKGATKWVQDLKNDPSKVAELKDQGYDLNAVADQAYFVDSHGRFNSANDYNQHTKDVNNANKAAAKKAGFGTDVNGWLDSEKAKAQQAAKTSQQAQLNAANDTLMSIHNDATQRQVNNAGVGNFGQELERGIGRAANAITLGGLGELDKKLHGGEISPLLVDRTGAGGWIDKGSDFVGSALPFLASDGITSAIGGAKLAALGEKGVVGKLGQLAIKGVGQGALVGAGQEGIKAGFNPQQFDLKQALENVGIDAGIGAVANPLLHVGGGLLKQLNLNGQVAKMLEGNATKIDPESFVQELQKMKAPTGNFSNVVADQKPLLPKPYEQKYNINVPETPTSQPLNAKENDWFNFAQQGSNVPQARGLLPNIAVPKTVSGNIRSMAEDTLNRSKTFDNAPSSGFNQRLLDVQNEMKGLQNNTQSIANRMASDGAQNIQYKPDVESLYQQVRKPNDPKTFDDLVKMTEMEHNQANPGLTSMLRSDPKIKQSIQALNNLGKPSKKVSSLTPKIETAPKKMDLKLPELKSKQNTHDLLQNLKVNSKEIPIDEGKKGGKSLFMSLNPSDNMVKSVKTDKLLPSMNKSELQDTLSKLEKQEELYKGQKGSKVEAELKAIQEDKKKVNDFLMKMDLQKFAEKAPKETPASEKKTKQEKAIAHSQAKQVAKKIEEKGNPITADTVKKLQEMKDIGPNQVLTKNIYEIADKLPKEIGDKLKTELNTAKSAHVDNLEKRSNDVYNKMVKDLGINKGSKDSALVQDFGEKTLAKKYLEKQGMDPEKVSKEELDKINLEQLKQKAPDKWKNIVEADKYFRDEYNKLIDEVNAVRKQIYPKNPDKIVPKRDDYYHHFNQLEGFDHFKDLLMNSNAIDPHLAGISPNTKPNAKWAGFMQKRGNGAYKSDAVGGFLKYLQASSHSTHIDPMIKVLRDTAENIATATEGTKNLNNLKAALEDHANDLAGKTNPIDRLVQDKVIGRKAFQVINVINRHIKKNMILGNIGSLFGQIGNVPLTLGKAKLHSIPGVMDTLGQAAKALLPGAEKDAAAPINQSQWLKERFSGKYFRRFDNGLLKKPEHMAVWMLETADRSGTYFAWNSMYRKALSKGIADPIKYADEQTRHIIAGRGVGEVPIAQKSKIVGLVAPFTLEVANAWKVLGKQMSEKDFAGVVTFLAASYGLNTVMRDVKGNDVSFNPVGAVMDGINDKKALNTGDKAKLAAGNLAGEIAGNIPGGSYIPQLLGGINPAAKKTIFGNNSPDRFGTGVGVTGTAFAPIIDLINGDKNKLGKDALKIALPFGGNQVQKTLSGSMALSKGGAFNKKGQLEYPIDSKNTTDLLQSLLLGPSTASQGRTYFKNHQSALSDKQTQQYETAANKQDYYDKLQIQRQTKTIQKSMKDVQKDPSLTPQEKQLKLMALIQQLQKLQK